MNVWRFGRVEFDEVQGTLLVGGEPVPLDRNSRALLTVLVHNARTDVGKDRLLEAGWPNARGQGDRIDLSAIDANTALGGDQAFAFIGAAAFSGTAGELRYEAGGPNTFVEGDTDGDGLADFSNLVSGTIAFAAGDFVL